MKLGIVTNKYYTNKQNIKKFLYITKHQFRDDVSIISLNRKNLIDEYIKKTADMFNIKYFEIIPYHEKWNSNCIDKPYLYNKKFSGRYFYIAYNKFVKYCDNILILDSEKKSDEVVDIIIKLADKYKKHAVILRN